MTMKRIAAVAASVWLCAGGAFAATLTADEVLRQVNLLVRDDLTIQSNMEGRAWIGGSVRGSGEFHTLAGNAPAPSDLPALMVGGSVSGDTPKVNGGGDAVIAGDLQNLEIRPGGTAFVAGNVTGRVQGGGTLVRGPVSIPDLWAPIEAASAVLGAMSGTGPRLVNGNLWVFDAAPDDQGRTVYSVSAEAFSGWSQIEVQLQGARQVVINVTGAAPRVGFNTVNTPNGLASNILWNFPDAGTLALAARMVGQVLAPQAAATMGGGVVEGTLAVRSLQMTNQVHVQTWGGGGLGCPGLPGCNPRLDPEPSGPPAVPVPAAGPLLAAAVGWLVWRRRSRRRAA